MAKDGAMPVSQLTVVDHKVAGSLEDKPRYYVHPLNDASQLGLGFRLMPLGAWRGHSLACSAVVSLEQGTNCIDRQSLNSIV